MLVRRIHKIDNYPKLKPVCQVLPGIYQDEALQKLSFG